MAGNGGERVGPELRYTCDLNRLPPELRDRFVALDADPATRAFLEALPQRRHGRLFTVAQLLLCQLVSDFDANGLLGTYPMHLLSTAQWQALLGERPGGSLLDVGAGSGDITEQLAPLFDRISTTETSWGMARRLRQRGLGCVRTDVASQGVPDGPHAVIACLNVLDRCARPLTLLCRLHAGLEPRGRLLLSMPLPYAPFVYDGPYSVIPQERLPIDESGWEQGAASLVREVLAPLSFETEALSRAPYLSVGDATHPHYVLDAVILVCRKA